MTGKIGKNSTTAVGSLNQSSSATGIISSSGGGGTADHKRLTNRDALDQHPIKSITGLQDALDNKATKTDLASIKAQLADKKAKGLYYDFNCTFARKPYWYVTSEIDEVTNQGDPGNAGQYIISGPYDLGQGGGSGGGGGVTIVTLTNKDPDTNEPWWPTAVAIGAITVLKVYWSSLREDDPTGNGTMFIYVNDTLVTATTLETTFTNAGDVTYTAHWSKINTEYRFKFSHRRATYSSAYDPSSVSPFDIERIMLVNEVDENRAHGSDTLNEKQSFPGYKIDRAMIFSPDDTSESNEKGENGLKTLAIDGNTFFDFDADGLQLSNDFRLEGKYPNHPLDVQLLYVPDDAVTYNVTIKFRDENNVQIREDEILSYSVEDIVDFRPEILGDLSVDYAFDNAIVAPAPSDPTNNIFGLGYWHVDEEQYTADAISQEPNKGRFRAVMPNQDLEITYKYHLANQTVILEFGENMPLVDQTSNGWASTIWRSQTPIPHEIRFTGATGSSIYNCFDNNNYSSDLALITDNSGIGNHIKLPTFANDLWDGFKWDAWYIDDNKVTDPCFNYAFQYEPELIYTARWNRDITRERTIDIRYYR